MRMFVHACISQMQVWVLSTNKKESLDGISSSANDFYLHEM